MVYDYMRADLRPFLKRRLWRDIHAKIRLGWWSVNGSPYWQGAHLIPFIAAGGAPLWQGARVPYWQQYLLRYSLSPPLTESHFSDDDMPTLVNDSSDHDGSS